MLFVCAANAAPSYSGSPSRISDAMPCTLPPPWMNTSTGSALVAVAAVGAHTVNVRQSSLPMPCVASLAESCTQLPPNVVLAMGVDQQACVCGGCQRNPPTGGAA